MFVGYKPLYNKMMTIVLNIFISQNMLIIYSIIKVMT